MPRKTEWIHRVPSALEVLEAAAAPPLLDRRDVEHLLNVSPRQALRILVRLGAAQVGKNLFISQEEFKERLQALYSGDDARYERRRLHRLDQALVALARDLKARNVPIPATATACNMEFPALPLSIRLQPGRLEVDFKTPEDLLSQLFELSQAIANDYGRFEALASAGAP